MRKNGFTFIEILIVITIIGVLTAVGLSSYANANKKSRDVRREADLKQIQAALEMCKTTTGVYPDSLGSSIVCAGETFMSEVPDDPQATKNYTYTPGEGLITYTLCAEKELPSDPTTYYVNNP